MKMPPHIKTKLDEICELVDLTDPVKVYELTGCILQEMLNGNFNWESGCIVRDYVYKRAQEAQMREWQI